MSNRHFSYQSTVTPTRILRRAYSGQHFHPDSGSVRTGKVIIWTMIGLNTVVFGIWQVAIVNRDSKLAQFLRQSFTLSLRNLQAGRYYTAITSAFSHQNLGHFIFNMVALQSFGLGLAMVAGLAPYHLLSLSVTSAVFGSLGWVWQQTSHRPGNVMDQRNAVNASALGASGLIMGLGSALACLRPFMPFNIMFIPVSIPLWAVTVLYAGVDLYYLDRNTGVGHSAHLGGALAGVLYYALAFRRFGGVASMLRR